MAQHPARQAQPRARARPVRACPLPMRVSVLDLSGLNFQHQPGLSAPSNGITGVRPFDPYAIKRDFPILQRNVHGRPLVWLDNAATTQKPQAVIDRISLLLRARELEHPPRRAHAGGARDRRLRGRARQGAPLPQRAVAEGDRLRARRDRGDQPGRAELGPAQRRAGRRDRHHLARAPREHRALAAAVRREGRAPARRSRSTTAAR